MPASRESIKRKRMEISERRKGQFRKIYELLWFGNSRMHIKDIASELQVDPRTTSTVIEEAFNLGVVTIPQIRRRSHKNMMEHVYFIRCKDPLKVYSQYSEDLNVVYHAVMIGFADLMVIARKKIDIEGDILIEGCRSDYHIAYAPNHSWENAIQIMREKVENFSPKEYEPEGIIQTHWNEIIEWDEEDEKLFREFKYDLRKKFTPIMKKHLISTTKIYQWLERLPETCTVFTRYFPGGASWYDPFLFMFETDYEDFIIDLFSELPTSAYFFKVSDKLFLSGRMLKESLRKVDLDMTNIAQLHIPLLVGDLRKKGILKEEADAIFRYSCTKDL